MQAGDTTYHHTQKAPLCLVIYLPAIFGLIIALIAAAETGVYVPIYIVAITALIGPCFHYLRVQDRGDRLGISFGPIPLFRRSVLYADIEKVEVGQTTFLDGWGIHLSMRGGWVWNIWGWDCVVVSMKNRSLLRIGTNDPGNLARFLESKMVGEDAPSTSPNAPKE